MARVARTDAAILVMDALPGLASLGAPGPGSQVAPQEAQSLREGNTEIVAVELRQEPPATLTEAGSDAAAFEIDQNEVPIIGHKEVVWREVVLVNTGVVKPTCEHGKSLEDRAPLRAWDSGALEHRTEVLSLAPGDHRVALPQRAQDTLLADGDRSGHVEAKPPQAMCAGHLAARLGGSEKIA
jgi:hypothetical protein